MAGGLTGGFGCARLVLLGGRDMTDYADRLRWRAGIIRQVDGNDSLVAAALFEAASRIGLGGDLDVVDGWLRGRIDALEGVLTN